MSTEGGVMMRKAYDLCYVLTIIGFLAGVWLEKDWLITASMLVFMTTSVAVVLWASRKARE